MLGTNEGIMARYRQGPIDWFVIALSPVLVIGLITSFLFFHTGVLYGEGGADTPWNYYLFWYIFGMVLTARISLTQEIAHRASLYSLVLAGAVWMFLAGLVKVPGMMEVHVSAEALTTWYARGIAALLVGLGWFLCWKITIDVTDIEENTRIKSGGHFDPAQASPTNDAPMERMDDSAQKLRRLKNNKRILKAEIVDPEQAKPVRTPGSWVIGFVLICLPLFAGGQFLIPANESDRRVYGLGLAGVFFGCALGLLMTTHFLALRLYLGRRGIPMPVGMALSWLGLGGIFIIGVIVASMVLPGPDTPALYQKLTASKSAYQHGSKLAQKQGAEGKGDEKVAAKQEVDQKEGKKTVEGKKGEGNNKKGDQKGGDQKGGKNQENPNPGDQKKDKDNQPGAKPKGDVKENKGKAGDKKGEEPSKDGNNKEAEAPRESSKIQESLGKISKIVAILIFLPLAVLVLVGVLKFMGLQQGGWLDWLNRLFASFKPKNKDPYGGKNPEMEIGAPRMVSRRFGDMENPFQTGEASNMKDNDLVLTTTEAVLAWAEDSIAEGKHGETFREVVRRLIKNGCLSQGIEELVPYQQCQQYYRLPGKTEACAKVCQQVWKLLEESPPPSAKD